MNLDQIIQGMQFAAIYNKNPMNTSDQAREVITWQFAGSSAPADMQGRFNGWTALSNSERAEIIAALNHIESFLNVDFRQVFNSADPDLNLGKVALSGNVAGLGGYSMSYRGSEILDYDSFAVFDNELNITNRTSLVLHELGHALGLKHPFDDPTVPAGTDSNKYTLMSYTPNPDNGEDSDAMMLYDILALQDIWGAVDYNTGNTRYTGKRTDTVDTIWDTGGVDIFDAKNYSTSVDLDLREGMFSRFGNYEDVSIAFGVQIENANGGSGGDRITGNTGANTVFAHSGNDWIEGLGGGDKLKGNRGEDIIFGGSGNDKVYGGRGNDTLHGDGGNDMLFGAGGRDTFVFERGDARDRIKDFKNDVDTLDLTDFNFASVDQAMSFAEQTTKGVVFDFDGGDRLKLNNAVLGDVADDLLI